MKILITGANGQVGKELSSCANARGHDVLATARTELDITQAQSVNDFIKSHPPDIVINAAAYTAVDKAENDQSLAYAINRDGAENIAVACKTNNIPLLHMSTDYVFDGTKSDPYNENDKVAPLGTYGKSKWQGEEAIRKQMNHYIILRVAWVFGAQGNNFVKTMLRLSKDRDNLNVVSDQFGGPTPSKKIAETLIAMAEKFQNNKILNWGTYHYCGRSKSTWYEFAKEIFKQANEMGMLDYKVKVNPIITAEYPTPTKRPNNSMLDCSKVKEVFGVEMPDWRTALSEVLTELQSIKKHDIK